MLGVNGLRALIGIGLRRAKGAIINYYFVILLHVIIVHSVIFHVKGPFSISLTFI